MKLNDFNSKVNLPKLCALQNITDYQFIKLPTFGWYGYNRDKTFIGNIFEITPNDDHGKLYNYIVKHRPGLLDFNISYSEVADQRLRSNHKQFQAWTSCYKVSLMEAERYNIKSGSIKVPLSRIYEEQGYPNIIGNGIGVVTPLVRDRFSFLPWPKNSTGKLLVPTFSTPRHIASLELFDWETLEPRHELFVNDEKGWYGQLGTRIVRNFKEMAITGGNTWDYKCDYWNDRIIDISDSLPVSDYIKIWTEAKSTIFKRNPIEFIAESGQEGEVQNHITSLTYNQIVELEKVCKRPLALLWRQAREQVVQLGGQTYVKRDNCYFVQKKGSLLQISNFVMDIESIVKRGKGFVRNCHIYYREKAVPVEIDNKYFETHHKFTQGMNKVFVESGLGIPVISPQFNHQILQIINAFNEHVEVTT